MSIRAKFLGFVDVIMRIPPLFLLDEILKMNLFESSSSHLLLNRTLEQFSSNLTETETGEAMIIDFYASWLTLLKCLIFMLGTCTSDSTYFGSAEEFFFFGDEEWMIRRRKVLNGEQTGLGGAKFTKVYKTNIYSNENKWIELIFVYQHGQWKNNDLLLLNKNLMNSHIDWTWLKKTFFLFTAFECS